jgi:SAM-dependent methyltransferase
MEVHEALQREQAFHDRQAQARRTSFLKCPGQLQFADDQYLDHEPWIRPALAHLGDLGGRRVLDFGCGHGMASVVLARRGARVTAFDLSGGYLDEARARAAANRVAIDFVQTNGEFLPFADGSFARIWGNAVLHHLNLGRAAGELRRVLTRDGVAVFCEPWGGNPLLNWARRYLPYPGKDRTPEETPLSARDLDRLRAVFPCVEVRGFQFLSMVRRVLGHGAVSKALAGCDDRLIACLPGMQRWCRYVVITLRK